VLIVIYVNDIRLDFANSSLVVDVSICPLTKDNVYVVAPHAQKHRLRCTRATKEEFELWMAFIPALIERARHGWEHTNSCEYLSSPGEFPLAKEPGTIPWFLRTGKEPS